MLKLKRVVFLFNFPKVFLKAGNGGDGCMSFLRQKYMPNGGPNGGNGGKGGDLILLADENVSDLRNYHFKKQPTIECDSG